MASLFFVTGSRLDRARKEHALESARAVLEQHALTATAGVTSPNPQTVVLRVLAPLVEPAMGLLKSVRAAWRHELWTLQASSPRIWSM
jgi:urease accessory protein